MAKQAKSDASLRCSFCGKSRDQVRKLIAGPTVYICDECVGLCNDIISEEWQEAKEEISAKLRKPFEINQHLNNYLIGQEGAQDENVSNRSFTGSTGTRMQKFLNYLGVDKSYLFMNTFVYTITGQYSLFGEDAENPRKLLEQKNEIENLNERLAAGQMTPAEIQAMKDHVIGRLSMLRSSLERLLGPLAYKLIKTSKNIRNFCFQKTRILFSRRPSRSRQVHHNSFYDKFYK